MFKVDTIILLLSYLWNIDADMIDSMPSRLVIHRITNIERY